MIDYLSLRKKYWYSQEYVANILWISRITYNSREKWETEWKRIEIKKINNIYLSNYTDISDRLISDNAEMSVHQLEYILEWLEDMGLLSENWCMVRSNIWNRFIKWSKIYTKRYIETK